MHDEYVFQALRAGASGYILKEAADTELITALHVIQSGQFYLSPTAQSVSKAASSPPRKCG